MSAFDDVLAANEQYAASFTGAELQAPAAKGLMVVTCMDSRLDPLRMLGLERGDAKVYRNAGARVTDDVLATVVVAHAALGVRRVLVLQHTTCAMVGKTEADVHALVAERTGTDTRSLTFGVMADQRTALERDVQRIRSWPFLPRDLHVAGALYDVRTGRLQIVVPEE